MAETNSSILIQSCGASRTPGGREGDPKLAHPSTLGRRKPHPSQPSCREAGQATLGPPEDANHGRRHFASIK